MKKLFIFLVFLLIILQETNAASFYVLSSKKYNDKIVYFTQMQNDQYSVIVAEKELTKSNQIKPLYIFSYSSNTESVYEKAARCYKNIDAFLAFTEFEFVNFYNNSLKFQDTTIRFTPNAQVQAYIDFSD